MTPDHQTDAVVLKAIDYSDTSLIARLFTNEFGKVTVMAKGARKSRHGTGGLLQPPNQLAVNYRHKDGRDIQTLTACEYTHRQPALLTDMTRSATAMMAVEMLDRAVHDYDPHPLIFRLISAVLSQLGNSHSKPVILMHFFQLHLARQLGFAPQLDNCIHCGRHLEVAVVESMVGHLSCPQCRSGVSRQLDAPCLDYLRGLQHTHINQTAALDPGGDAAELGGQFLLDHLFIHVEGMKNLKSLAFWQEVQA